MGARALLLDLDRTLVDLQSFTDYSSALGAVRTMLGAWPDVDVPETDWDAPTMACMSVLHALTGDDRWPEISAAIARYERDAIPQSRVMPTVAETLAVLARVPVAVVTLVAPEVVPDALARHGIRLAVEVDVVVGRSSEVPPKPEPDGLWVACRALAVEPHEAVMIGDSSWDAQAARRAGVEFVGVPSSAGGLPGAETEATFADAVARALG